jgi:hypothetical protein
MLDVLKEILKIAYHISFGLVIVTGIGLVLAGLIWLIEEPILNPVFDLLAKEEPWFQVLVTFVVTAIIVSYLDSPNLRK